MCSQIHLVVKQTSRISETTYQTPETALIIALDLLVGTQSS